MRDARRFDEWRSRKEFRSSSDELLGRLASQEAAAGRPDEFSLHRFVARLGGLANPGTTNRPFPKAAWDANIGVITLCGFAQDIMSSHITQSDIKAFADTKVNLPAGDAQAYRDQVNRLRDRLKMHIAENPGFALVKMLHAGSVAKGTALKTVNDLDAAVYVRSDEAPGDDSDLVPWLAERVREANPNLSHDQIVEQSHCVTISFRGSGLEVDVVPVLYEGDEDDKGYLVDKNTGARMLTSIPLHLEFIRTRKDANPTHFAQVVRLAKWWARELKIKDPSFRCKSFLIELVLAHLADTGEIGFTDYGEALSGFFAYVVKSQLKDRIAFTDYYPASELPAPTGAAIEVFDPVNPNNNITVRYTDRDRQQLVDAAETAGDAIDEALFADTKGRAVECWQLVLGSSFRPGT